MSAKPDALTGEILEAGDLQDGADAVMFTCTDCGRCVIGETVRVRDHGLTCTGCDALEAGEIDF
ncbi:hypothetical protein ATO8_19794 [Roseivivax marinus]|uniref:Uncharacterized protein n=1 Tax=Roseivivax marinus TaxID=1379903 RepID=W4HDV2_9RHOB|nr:hypothetical protein [Roseivivax marinus]ETW10874.1 hypothetical protein ATO8_19794 [Roseivivax marinus]